MADVGDLAALSNWAYDPNTKDLQAIGNGAWVERANTGSTGASLGCAINRMARASVAVACLGLFFGKAYGAKVTVPQDASCGVRRGGETQSVEQIGTAFGRPSDIAQLLHNLKKATDDGLFLEPNFYGDDNLLKFFGASNVLGSTQKTPFPKTFTQRVFKLVGSLGGSAPISVEILKSCQLIEHYTSPSGEVPTHVRATSSAIIDLTTAPAVTVSAVRAVFGKESRTEFDTGETQDGNFVALTSKGSLHYEGSGAAAGTNSDIKESGAIFVVKLPNVPLGPPVRQIVDRDLIQSVRIMAVER